MNAVNPFKMAELRSILGHDLDDALAANLLRYADGSVQRAVNHYLDSPRAAVAVQKAEQERTGLQTGHWPVVPEPSYETPQKPRFPTGQTSGSLKQMCNEVSNGPKSKASDAPLRKPEAKGSERVTANKRGEDAGWPKSLGTVQVVAYTTVDIVPATLPVGSRVQISRSRPVSNSVKAPLKLSKGGKAPNAWGGQNKKHEKKDYILRWNTTVLGECGRLPVEVSKLLAVLLDADGFPI